MEFVEKVDFNTAEGEVAAWLDAKRIKPLERSEKANFINCLIEAVQCGDIEIDGNTNVITHNLVFPIKNSDGAVTKSALKYNPRAETGNLQAKTGNLKGIGMAVYVAYASALTGEITAVLNKLDSEDFKILQAITAFFL